MFDEVMTSRLKKFGIRLLHGSPDRNFAVQQSTSRHVPFMGQNGLSRTDVQLKPPQDKNIVSVFVLS